MRPGIITTGSTLSEEKCYVSAYRVLYSNDGKQWFGYKESNSVQNKVINKPCSLNSYKNKKSAKQNDVTPFFQLVQMDQNITLEVCRDTNMDCYQSSYY